MWSKLAMYNVKRDDRRMAQHSTNVDTNRAKWALRLLILVFFSTIAAACAEAPDSNENNNLQATSTPFPTAPAVARETYTVQRGDVVEELTFTGRWEPRDQLGLAFEVDGTVRQVNVRRGDTVTAGEVLADLNIEQLEDQLEDQQTSLEDALADADDTAQGQADAIENAQLELFNAQLALQRLQDDAPSVSMRSAIRAVEDAERNLENAERSYREALANNSLAQGGSAVDSAYEALLQARRSLDDAEFSYAEAAAGAGDSIETYNEQIIDAENRVILAERSLQDALEGDSTTASSRQIRDLQTSIARLEEDIARSTLTSPIDGVVLEVTVQASDPVQAFSSVITVGISEPREVIASIPIAQVQRLSVGLIGVCNVINQQETAVQCRVRQIPASSRDADQTTRIAASLEDFAEPGAIVEVAMPLQVREDVLWLPPAPIREFQGQPFVLLETPEGPRRTFIEIGLQTDDRVEIVSGLEEGDVVIGQ